MSRKSKQLIRSHIRPDFGLPWIPILLGVGSLVIGITGLVATTMQPASEVRIVVEGQQPWNISQETVEAALDEPIASWRPLTLVVTDRTLSLEEQQGNLAPGTDILLSTKLPEPNEDRFADDIRQTQALGRVGIRPVFEDPAQNLTAGQDVHDAYQVNVGLGHGPLAVLAAAQEASLQLSDRPEQSFWPWLMGTILGLVLTAFAMSQALRHRSKWEARFRRLTAAQSRLAGVVLDLEALEVTYLAIDAEQRPPGFTTAWTTVRDASLDLARVERKVVAAVCARGSGMTSKTARQVERFEAQVSDLVAAADAVMGAGAVIGRSGGGESTFQRLGAPLTFATRELLTRLRAAPTGAVEPQIISGLESALDALFEASTGKTGGAETTLRAWERAERGLKRQAQALSRKLHRMLPRRKLRRMLERHPPVIPRPTEDLSVLRTSLGLTPQGSWRSLNALDAANAMAREVFGRLPEFDDAPEQARRKAPVNPKLRKGIGLGAKVLAGIALVLASLFMSLMAVFAIDEVTGNLPTGNRPLKALHLEPNDSRFDVEEIRRNLPDNFIEDLEVTVVAGDAEDDLLLSRDFEVIVKNYDPQDPSADRRVDANLLLETMWELKAQYPHLVDESTGELLPGQAVVPVYFFDDGYMTVPAWMTSAVYSADARRMGGFNWDSSEYFFGDDPVESVSYPLKQLSKGQQWNGYTWGISDSDNLILFLIPILGIVMFIGYQVLRYGGSMSMRLGRFGKDASRLRTVRKDLEAMTLGLDDSRLNAVFMFDRSSAPLAADSDQRLFESALAVAWRMAEELASRPLAQRLGPDYTDQIRRFEYLVSVLSVRDTDVAWRAQALLDAEREA